MQSFQNLFILKTDDHDTQFLKIVRPIGIIKSLSLIFMILSILLYRQLCLVTIKIQCIFANWMLSPELKSVESFLSQYLPKYPFCSGHLAP